MISERTVSIRDIPFPYPNKPRPKPQADCRSPTVMDKRITQRVSTGYPVKYLE